MRKVMVPLDWDTVDNIVVMQIQEMKESLEGYLIQVKNNKKGTVFDTDYKKDMKQIKEHIEACDKIYAYFGGNNK
jgi:predicted RND superfamily exporter protein